MSSVRTRFLHTEGFRLSAIYAGVFALSVLVIGLVVVVITDHTFRDQMIQSSRADIAAIQNGYASEGIPEAREVVNQLLAAPGTSDFILLQRGPLRLAGNLPPMSPKAGVLTLPGRDANRAILGVGTVLAPNLYVFSGSDLSRAQAAHQQIVYTLLWLFGGALLIAVLGGTLVSRSFLQRTDAMARACRAIMDGDLKARIPVRGTQDELDRLAGTINEMLARIAALMENLHQVTNDIAHDLRTPVSHLRNRLERARTECATPEEYAKELNTAIVKSDEILGLFSALLRVAQIEGGARRAAFDTIELAPLLTHIRELFDPVVEEADDRLTLIIRDNAAIDGDRALLIQMLSNLVENSILHTPPGTEIEICLSRSGDEAIVAVRDNGPGVPSEEHAKLFQRLYRRETSRTQPGYGLGLALVKAVAELHGGSVRILDGISSGLAVEISLPLRQSP